MPIMQSEHDSQSVEMMQYPPCSPPLPSGASHRYYESRRRIGIEELPEHKDKAAIQKKRRKYRARQQRVSSGRGEVPGRRAQQLKSSVQVCVLAHNTCTFVPNQLVVSHEHLATSKGHAVG